MIEDQDKMKEHEFKDIYEVSLYFPISFQWLQWTETEAKKFKEIANNVDASVINQVTLHLYKALCSEYFQESCSESLEIET